MMVIVSLIASINIPALGTTVPDKQNANTNYSHEKKPHDKYHKLSKELLLQKLGLTENEVKKGRDSGKTLLDIAKGKGITLDKFKEAMISAKTEAIKQAVKDGKLTEKEGSKKITEIQDKIKNWDGTMKHKRHK